MPKAVVGASSFVVREITDSSVWALGVSQNDVNKEYAMLSPPHGIWNS
jgi:hypothetical protein